MCIWINKNMLILVWATTELSVEWQISLSKFILMKYMSYTNVLPFIYCLLFVSKYGTKEFTVYDFHQVAYIINDMSFVSNDRFSVPSLTAPINANQDVPDAFFIC